MAFVSLIPLRASPLRSDTSSAISPRRPLHPYRIPAAAPASPGVCNRPGPARRARTTAAPAGEAPAAGAGARARVVAMSVGAASVYKEALLERLRDVNFGRAVVDDRKQQAEIETLIKSVEATNRSASPGTDPNINAVWSMIYTTSTSILSAGRPSFLQAYRIEQTIDAPNGAARNEEAFRFGPLEVTNAVDASLTPVSAARFDVQFIQFIVAGLFKINVQDNPRFAAWLEVTYLDEDLRISRGNKGNVFVLVKKEPLS